MVAPPPSRALTIDRKGGLSLNAAQLVQAARRGERWAWDAIVDRYGRLVYSVARRYGFDAADADDVFQDVFVALYERLDALREADRLSSWLITTAHRACWRVGRKSGRTADLEAHMPDIGAPDERDTDRWERQDRVRDALERLGGRCAHLLTMLFVDGRDYDTIATALDMRVGSIGPTRARCFAKLERILGDAGGDSTPGG